MVTLRLESETSFDVREAYAEHGAAIFGFALNGLGERTAAEDCVQETFLRAWRSRERYQRSRGSERTWLFAIARHVVIDSLRSRSRRPAAFGDDRVERASDPVTEESAIVDRLALYEALATMTPEHRQVIAAVQLDGLTYQQLSDRSGVPVATLRTRMFYGLKALRTALGGENHHG